MKGDPAITGGYILYPRCFLYLLEEAPLLDRALWTWLNCQASHRDRDHHTGRLARGQLLTTSVRMRDALSHRTGCSLRRPSKSVVLRALERLRKRNMIASRRTTRGLIVTICQYDLYQNPAHYGRDATATAEAPQPQPDRQEKKNERKGKGPPSSSRSSYSKTFEEMDRERAATALARAGEEFLADEQA